MKKTTRSPPKRPVPGQTARLVDGIEAARRLGVRRESLYAYVSRGLIRSVPHPENPRQHLYSEADIDALQNRKLRLRRPKAAAATALDWGLPVLQTAISGVADGHLLYRGRDVADLVETATLEETAALLWNASPAVFETAGGSRHPPAWARVAAQITMPNPVERALALMPLLMPQDVSPLGLARERLPLQAAQLMLALADALAPGLPKASGPLHARLADAWDRPRATDAIRRLLVLCADHELNPSTFAVRVAASTGTKLSGVLLAGLATLSGPRHGGMAGRLSALMDGLAPGEAVAAAVTERLARGEALPGFGHPLYPDGDPRAALMLAHATPDRVARQVMQAAADLAGLAPNVDFALVAAERRFDLPRGAALAIFALGRSAGWFAHAFEQIEMGSLIRPRAEFVSR